MTSKTIHPLADLLDDIETRLAYAEEKLKYHTDRHKQIEDGAPPDPWNQGQVTAAFYQVRRFMHDVNRLKRWHEALREIIGEVQ